jgi:hypothetical protein
VSLRSKRIGEVIQAADLARRGEHRELIPDLIDAYQRLAAHPTKLDASCSGMEAIVRALDAFEEPAREVYAHAVKHVQMSPLLDDEMQQIDLAAGLRRQAILAMVRTGDPQALEAATDLLADPKTVARAGAANALRVIGSEAAIILLRYCVKRGERKAEVLTECFAAMLDYSASNLDLVIEYALGDDEVIASIAALAIADARPAGALDVLKDAFAGHRNPDNARRAPECHRRLAIGRGARLPHRNVRARFRHGYLSPHRPPSLRRRLERRRAHRG